MKKLIILILGIFLIGTENVLAEMAESEVRGTLDTSGVSTGLEVSLPCSPSSVSNGTVNTTTCVISCNAGYTLSGNSCVANSGGGGGGGGGGGIVPTCLDTQLACINGIYHRGTGVSCNDGNLGKACTVSSTGSTTGSGLVIENLEDLDTTLSGTTTSISGSINDEQNLIGSILLNTQLSGGSQVTQITGESGSLVLSPNDGSNIRLIIPAGTEVSGNASWDGKLSAPYVIQQTSKGIVIKVGNDLSGLTFSQPVTIEIDTDLPEGTKLEVYFTVDGTNLEYMVTATVKNGKITFTTTHFSYFVLRVLASEAKLPFPDIADSFAKDNIIRLVNLGVIKGFDDGTFRPNASASRAEFLAMVMKTFSIELDENATTTFTDIPSDGAWMIKYIEKAKEYGIKGQVLKGKPIFRPNDPISRAEALAILFNIAKIDTASTNTLEFTDVTVQWMIPYTIKARELGIANGQMINNKLMFRPNDPITRAETVTIIVKAMDLK